MSGDGYRLVMKGCAVGEVFTSAR